MYGLLALLPLTQELVQFRVVRRRALSRSNLRVDIADRQVDVPTYFVGAARIPLFFRSRCRRKLAGMAIPVICRRLLASSLPAFDVHRILAVMSFGPTEHDFIFWRRVRVTAFHAARIPIR